MKEKGGKDGLYQQNNNPFEMKILEVKEDVLQDALKGNRTQNILNIIITI